MYYTGRNERMPTISLRLSERDNELIKHYASVHNISVSELVRNAVIDMIENEIDVETFEKAVAETQATYTLEEVKKELGF
jgi:uncharacterized protein (DUF1778 family)